MPRIRSTRNKALPAVRIDDGREPIRRARTNVSRGVGGDEESVRRAQDQAETSRRRVQALGLEPPRPPQDPVLRRDGPGPGGTRPPSPPEDAGAILRRDGPGPGGTERPPAPPGDSTTLKRDGPPREPNGPPRDPEGPIGRQDPERLRKPGRGERPRAELVAERGPLRRRPPVARAVEERTIERVGPQATVARPNEIRDTRRIPELEQKAADIREQMLGLRKQMKASNGRLTELREKYDSLSFYQRRSRGGQRLKKMIEWITDTKERRQRRLDSLFDQLNDVTAEIERLRGDD